MSQNLLEEYRRIQRALRRDYDAFTSVHCASCPTPCCRQPARIGPTDILLAEGVGWKARVEAVAATASAERERSTQADASDAGAELPCEHLGEKGCTFPADLRPYGCTAFICRYMYQYLDRKTLSRIRRNLRALEQSHQALMTYLHRKTRE